MCWCEMLSLLLLVREEPPVPRLVAVCGVMLVELVAGPSCGLNSWWSWRLRGGPKPLINHWLEQCSSSNKCICDGVRGAGMNEELETDRGCVKSGARWILKPRLNCHACFGLQSGRQDLGSPTGQTVKETGKTSLNKSLSLKRVPILNMKNVREAQHLEVLNQVHCLWLCNNNRKLKIRCSVKLRYSPVILVLLFVFKLCCYCLITSSDQSWRFWRKWILKSWGARESRVWQTAAINQFYCTWQHKTPKSKLKGHLI